VVGETGYRIERSLDNSKLVDAGHARSQQDGYSNTSLSAGTQYYYRVVALNAGGDSAAGTANNTTPPSPCPGGPERLGRLHHPGQPHLDRLDRRDGYKIERSLNNSTWTLVTTVNADVTSYSNTGLVGGTLYYYRVRAVNAGGTSLPSVANSSYTIPLTPSLTATVGLTPRST
jgi:titin